MAVRCNSECVDFHVYVRVCMYVFVCVTAVVGIDLHLLQVLIVFSPGLTDLNQVDLTLDLNHLIFLNINDLNEFLYYCLEIETI